MLGARSATPATATELGASLLTFMKGLGMRPRARSRALVFVLVPAIALAFFAGCSEEKRKPIDVKPTVVRDIPPPLRGTIGSEVSFAGVEPVLVSGIGLVVGLNGTGGKPLPDQIQSTMEREMGLQGIGKSNTGSGTAIDQRSPRELLRDPNTAVVIVQAAVPSGLPQGAEFDVYIEAVNADSLEGGLLWTTDLQVGPPATFAAVKARTVARARGPIFINPFAEPGKEGEGPQQTRGRVLNGGEMTNPFQIQLTLDNDSHQRARDIVSAINSRIPPARGDLGQTAQAKIGGKESGPTIVLNVPQRYRRSAADFLSLVRYMPIDQVYPEERSKRIVEAMKAEPTMADDLSYVLEGIGEKSLPFARSLYDYAEPVPRMAALRAGARLADARAATALRELAESGQGTQRLEAIALLAKIDGGPMVERTLQALLLSDELLVRVSAYEALVRRAERNQIKRLDSYTRANPDSDLSRASPSHLEALATHRLPPGSLQGVEREMVAGKFFLDIVPIGAPLIYVTQQGQPRIVLFGEDPRMIKPSTISAWNDRLLMVADTPNSSIRVMYKSSKDERPVTRTAPDTMRELILFLARAADPADPTPGLGMTYSEVVGALYAIQQAGGTNAQFATERDRLKGLILEAASGRQTKERPETPNEPDDLILLKPASPSEHLIPKPDTNEKPKIVPLNPPAPKK